MGNRYGSRPLGSRAAAQGEPGSSGHSGASGQIGLVAKRASAALLQRPRQTQARDGAAAYAARGLPTICSASAHGPASGRAHPSAKTSRAPYRRTRTTAVLHVWAAVLPRHAGRCASPAARSGDISCRETTRCRLASNASTRPGRLHASPRTRSTSAPKPRATRGSPPSRAQNQQSHGAPQRRPASSTKESQRDDRYQTEPDSSAAAGHVLPTPAAHLGARPPTPRARRAWLRIWPQLRHDTVGDPSTEAVSHPVAAAVALQYSAIGHEHPDESRFGRHRSRLLYAAPIREPASDERCQFAAVTPGASLFSERAACAATPPSVPARPSSDRIPTSTALPRLPDISAPRRLAHSSLCISPIDVWPA